MFLGSRKVVKMPEFAYVILEHHGDARWVVAICPDDQDLAKALCAERKQEEMKFWREMHPELSEEQIIAQFKPFSLLSDFEYERHPVTTRPKEV